MDRVVDQTCIVGFTVWRTSLSLVVLVPAPLFHPLEGLLNRPCCHYEVSDRMWVAALYFGVKNDGIFLRIFKRRGVYGCNARGSWAKAQPKIIWGTRRNSLGQGWQLSKLNLVNGIQLILDGWLISKTWNVKQDFEVLPVTAIAALHVRVVRSFCSSSGYLPFIGVSESFNRMR